MDRSNIVPIARTAQETTASQRRHFRVLVAVLVAAWAAVVIAAVTLTPLPPLVPFAILAVLVILAEHRFVLFGDETSMSGSMIVIVASVFVFADTAPLAGPVLIASLGGLYFPHLRARAWNLVAANSAIFGLSAGTAALASSWLPLTSSDTRTLTAAVACSASYWVMNSCLTGSAAAVRNGDSALMSTWWQIISEWQMLIVSTAAALMGMWLATNYRTAHFGFALLALFAALPLHRSWRADPNAFLFSRLFMIAGGWGVLVVSYDGSLMSGALIIVGVYLMSTAGNTPSSRYPLLVLTFSAILLSFTFAALELPRVAVYPLTVGMTTAAAVSTFWYRNRVVSPARKRKIPLVARFGLLTPTLLELCMLVFATALLALDQRQADFLLAVAALLLLSASGSLGQRYSVARHEGCSKNSLPTEAR